MCGGGDNKVEDADTGGEKTDSKYGQAKKFDPNFKGPIKQRSCTDVICCLLFFICVLLMAACSVLGYVRGDPIKLIYPTDSDSDGNLCGYGDYASKPNLMFFRPAGCAKMGVGVITFGCPASGVCDQLYKHVLRIPGDAGPGDSSGGNANVREEQDAV
ncbi:choline transporter-like protein 2 isoform X1 [Haliotis rubra]|uniref:choline transporter-like protein 2 isoform X1 n=1 Tax=Haliotis rubra TaxID=36100 RepID=UPI001EE509CE|nr:choline transporter-like protein 2 isoform X1 [Haliotis rubra]